MSIKDYKNHIIRINDRCLLTDSYANEVQGKVLDQLGKEYKKNNLLVIYDEQGNEIGRTHNKVVASGRIETIETMFRTYNISDSNPEMKYERPDNKTNPRWISTFGVGTGGCPTAEGNNPYIVAPDSLDLSIPLSFKDRGETDPNSKEKYWDNNKKKDFTSIFMNWDKEADDVYAVLYCTLGYNDLLNKVVNELGLYTCTHEFADDGSETIINKKDFKLWAKANMNSINKSPLKNQSSFQIAYKVFI